MWDMRSDDFPSVEGERGPRWDHFPRCGIGWHDSFPTNGIDTGRPRAHHADVG